MRRLIVGLVLGLLLAAAGAQAARITHSPSYLTGLTTLLGSLLVSPDNTNDLGASGATRFRDAYLARDLHVGGYLHLRAAMTLGVHAVTIASDGTTNANAEIISGLRPVVRIHCNDSNGCTLRFHEAGAMAGTVLRVVNIGANNMLVGDHTTVGTRQHLAGALTGTTNATLQLIFMRDTSGATGWFELGRSVN